MCTAVITCCIFSKSRQGRWMAVGVLRCLLRGDTEQSSCGGMLACRKHFPGFCACAGGEVLNWTGQQTSSPSSQSSAAPPTHFRFSGWLPLFMTSSSSSELWWSKLWSLSEGSAESKAASSGDRLGLPGGGRRRGRWCWCCCR